MTNDDDSRTPTPFRTTPCPKHTFSFTVDLGFYRLLERCATVEGRSVDEFVLRTLREGVANWDLFKATWPPETEKR